MEREWRGYPWRKIDPRKRRRAKYWKWEESEMAFAEYKGGRALVRGRGGWAAWWWVGIKPQTNPMFGGVNGTESVSRSLREILLF